MEELQESGSSACLVPTEQPWWQMDQPRMHTELSIPLAVYPCSSDGPPCTTEIQQTSTINSQGFFSGGRDIQLS